MSKGDETRQFIIERAAPIFNTKGIEATSMSDIMEATKLSKGSHYVHFKDKNDLAIAVVEYNIQTLARKIEVALSKLPTAKEKLFAFTDITTDVLNPLVTGGCPMMNIATEVDDTNPGINIKIKQGFDNTVNLIAGLVNLGISRGEFRTDWNGKDFGTVMFSMIEGAVMMARVDHNNNKTKLVAKKIKEMINDQAYNFLLKK